MSDIFSATGKVRGLGSLLDGVTGLGNTLDSARGLGAVLDTVKGIESNVGQSGVLVRSVGQRVKLLDHLAKSPYARTKRSWYGDKP